MQNQSVADSWANVAKLSEGLFSVHFIYACQNCICFVITYLFERLAFMSSKVSEQLVADFASVSLGSTAETELLPYGSSVPGRQRYLFYFLHRHLNFRIAEAESIAYMVTGKFVLASWLPLIPCTS